MDLIHKLQCNAAALLIEIQDVQGVTQKVVDNVIRKVNGIFETFLSIICDKFRSACGPHDALSYSEISDVLNSICGQNVFEGLDSRQKLDDHINHFFGLVKPVPVTFKEKKVTKGNTVKIKPVEWGYYIPFLPSLQQVLSCPEVLNCVKNPVPHTPGVYKSALDGAVYQNHPIVSQDPHTLAVGIYTDAAEMTDSASSKSGVHGLNFIYWVLYNIYPKMRSSIRSVFLLGAAKAMYIKKYGFKKILTNFVNSINQLSSTGVVFNINGVEERFHGLFLTCSGDNPGSANIGRFKESAAFSNKPCRQCYASQTDLYRSFNESHYVLRSKNRHLLEVQEVENNMFQDGSQTDENGHSPSVRHGVNGRSVLMDIHGCDITKALPQDFLHDVLEGTLKLDICCTLHHVLIEKKSMGIKDLNSRIKLYSKLVGVNKPSRIDMDHVQKGRLRLTAAETLNLAYILPFVLRKRKPGTNTLESVCDKKNLQLLILRLNITDLLFSDEFRTSDLPRLRRMTEMHHALFDELYPDKKIPKMHYELHYGTHILLYGPPCQYWCSRYEAKHAFFKRRWRLYRNLKDHAGTLSMAHQRNQAGLMLLSRRGTIGPFLSSSDFCGASVSKPLHTLQRKDDILRVFPQLSLNETVQQFKVVSVNGVKYKKDRVIIPNNSIPHTGPTVFGKVNVILKIQNKLYFVFQELQTELYDRDLNAFKVKHTRNFGLKAADDMAYNHALYFMPLISNSYVVVPHKSFIQL